MASQQTSPPNTTPEDVVLDYFVQNKNNSNWREADFRKQHPDHNFQSELDKLAKRELDGDASLKKIIRHARRLQSKPDANVVNNIYNSGTVGAIGNPNSVEIINTNENIPRKRQRSDAPDTDEEGFADSEDGRVPVTHQGTSAINQDIYSSGPASDTLLQTDLSNCIFLDGPHAPGLLDATALELLNKKFPKLPPASPYFHAALEACKPMIDDPRYWPNPPHGDWSKKDELEQSKIWHYVITAVSYFVNNYATIRLRAPTHGEGWADVNIWALLWDHAFLKSDTLTIDRKELSPNVRIATKHDGILRSAKTSCNRSLGFIEVKPDRNTNQNAKGVLADRLKVIETIVATLKAHNTPGMIIGGIICNGMTVNILRGTDLGNGQYAFKESSLDVSLETILYVVLSCWRMKLALEASYSTIVATLPQNLFE